MEIFTVTTEQELKKLPPAPYQYIADVGQDDAKLVINSDVPITEEEAVKEIKRQEIPIYYDNDEINLSLTEEVDISF